MPEEPDKRTFDEVRRRHQRDRGFKAAADPYVADSEKPPPEATRVDPRASSSTDEFCTRHSISRTTFHKLQQQGLGPVLMRIGTKVRISHEAELRWIRETEARNDVVTADMLRRKARAAAAKAIASPVHVSRLRQRERA